MKFLWTTIQVKNMEESLKFYQEVVGLKYFIFLDPNGYKIQFAEQA